MAETGCFLFDSHFLTDLLVGEIIMTDDSAEILFQSSSAGGPCEQFWHGQECSLFDDCPSRISSADHGVAHPSRCPEGWFWKGCRGVCHARTMQEPCHISIFHQNDATWEGNDIGSREMHVIVFVLMSV